MNSSEVSETACLVVGAGLSGLIAARELRRDGVDVVVLDKGRGVGGRLATRRIGAGVFDHGAQFFTVREPAFGRHVDEWLNAGIAREWARGFAHEDGVLRADSHPRYCGASGMTDIAKHLAAESDVRTNTRVERIATRGGDWELTTDAGGVWRARALLLTPPVPQSLALVESGDFRLAADAKARLASITYDSCIVVMTVIDEACALPEPGAVQIDGGEPVYWIADNNRKRISPQPRALTIHAGAAWSRAHYDAPDDHIAAKLIEYAARYLRDYEGAPANVSSQTWQVKRWRYSKPVVMHPERCFVINAPPLVFAGDAFGGARVEGAALSGLAAAVAIRGLLGAAIHSASSSAG